MGWSEAIPINRCAGTDGFRFRSTHPTRYSLLAPPELAALLGIHRAQHAEFVVAERGLAELLPLLAFLLTRGRVPVLLLGIAHGVGDLGPGRSAMGVAVEPGIAAAPGGDLGFGKSRRSQYDQRGYHQKLFHVRSPSRPSIGACHKIGHRVQPSCPG